MYIQINGIQVINYIHVRFCALSTHVHHCKPLNPLASSFERVGLVNGEAFAVSASLDTVVTHPNPLRV